VHSARNKFGKPALHLPARRYYWIIVTEIFAKCADTNDGTLVYASDVSWINMNVLTVLQTYKAQLKSDVAELTAEASRIWEATPDGVWFEYDANEVSEAVPPCSFWPTLEGSWIAGNWTAMPECYSKLGVAVLDGCCTYCGSRNALVQREMPTVGAMYPLAGCLACGWPASSDTSYLFVALAKPLVALARILEVLSRYEDILRLVITTVAVLLSLLKRSAFRFAIATSQRSFFTYHGAHPPRMLPSRAPGLLSGRAFQLHVAA
jgi:hypothetical protein